MKYFITVAIVVFFVSVIVFSFFGLSPEGYRLNEYLFEEKETFTNDDLLDYYYSETYTRPDRIVIGKIGIDTNIVQPDSRDVSVLDQALNQGAVHYPGSGSVESGNMFVFAHSTGLQFVQNQAFKTFNNLGKLAVGDTIEVTASGRKYFYRVTKVSLVNENEALVQFDRSRRMLTLSTCNSFGAKEERWVVEAEFFS